MTNTGLSSEGFRGLAKTRVVDGIVGFSCCNEI